MNQTLRIVLSAALTLTAGLAQAQIARPVADDPSRSNLVGLLQRPEVQQELHLDIRQKSALGEVQAQGVADVRQRVQQALSERSGLPDFKDMTDEQKRLLGERMQQQMNAALRAAQMDLDDKSLAVLSAAQVKRLRELDLQRRGPLSIVDSKVADRLQIESEHRVEVIRINGDLQEKLQAENQRIFQLFRTPGQGDPGGDSLKNATAAMEKSHRELRKAAETKALAALSDEERKRWIVAQGEKFTFRPDPPSPMPGLMRGGGIR